MNSAFLKLVNMISFHTAFILIILVTMQHKYFWKVKFSGGPGGGSGGSGPPIRPEGFLLSPLSIAKPSPGSTKIHFSDPESIFFWGRPRNTPVRTF